MTYFFLVSVLAGIFTVLAPCIFPFLPLVIGASEPGSRYVSRRAITVILSLSCSVILFTLLLKATTLFLSIPQVFWNVFSGVLIILVGIALLAPTLWARIPLIQHLGSISNDALNRGVDKKSYSGDVLVGLSLGPVFTTCSPTYLFIVATILPTGILEGVLYLLGFTLGLALSLLLIAYFGQAFVNKIVRNMGTASTVKKIFAVLIILVGIAIATGLDKELETRILDSGYGATIALEERLIERFTPRSTLAQETAPNGTVVLSDEDRNVSVMQSITLAGGCFWCTEAYLQEAQGVIDAVAGYTGGSAAEATYLQVARGTTKHREAVQVTYDTSIISTEQILDLYWAHIDPTDPTGQFADKGYQYTTAIYYHTDRQRDIALDSKMRLLKSGLLQKPVVTEILPSAEFRVAEEYHQDYYKKSSQRYEQYKEASGRAGFIADTWAKDAAIAFFRQEATGNMT
jgi:cytochrome c-type biogenesis protein